MHEGVQNFANESNEPTVLVRLYEVPAVAAYHTDHYPLTPRNSNPRYHTTDYYDVGVIILYNRPSYFIPCYTKCQLRTSREN